MTLHVTQHAIERAIERCGFRSEQEARSALTSPAVRRAAEFGAPYVRLPAKQRVVLCGLTVVTVLPAGQHLARLDRRIVRKPVHWEDLHVRTAGGDVG